MPRIRARCKCGGAIYAHGFPTKDGQALACGPLHSAEVPERSRSKWERAQRR
jgi:hypothetical protein